MHLVGVGLKKIEESLHPIPTTLLLKITDLIARLTLDHELAMLRLHVHPRHIGRNTLALAGPQQILKALLIDLSAEWTDHTILQRQPLVGEHQIVIHLDHTAEAATTRTRTYRVVERKQRRRLRLEDATGLRRVQTPRKMPEQNPIRNDHPQLTAAEVHRMVRRFQEARIILFRQSQPILNHLNPRSALNRSRPIRILLDPEHAIRPEPRIPLSQQGLPHLGPIQVVGFRQTEKQHDLPPQMPLSLQLLPYHLGSLIHHFPAGIGIKQLSVVGEPHLEIVTQLGHRAHG